MEKKQFARRMSQLRQAKGVSVRLLSLSKSLRRLSSRQLELLEQLVQEMK